MVEDTTVVYGATSAARKFIQTRLRDKKFIVVTTFGAEEINDRVSLSLVEFSRMDIECIKKIVICSEAVTEIIRSLRSASMPLEKCFFYDHSQDCLIPYEEFMLPSINTEAILYAVFDLSSNLPCFDVTNFVVLAESHRKRFDFEKICFIIIPDVSSSDEHIGARLFHSDEDHLWRVDHIVKAVMRCCPSCLSIIELPFREMLSHLKIYSDQVFPIGSLNPLSSEGKTSTFNVINAIKAGEQLSVLRPPKVAKDMVDHFLLCKSRGRKVLTVTLREYTRQTTRNSNIAAWVKFLNTLDRDEYFPVIIRDTYHMTCAEDPRLKKYHHFVVASADFCIRLALYDCAYINMGVSTGPTYPMSFLKNCRSIIFVLMDEENPTTSRATVERAGIEIGENFIFNDNNFQFTVWGSDSYQNIMDNFNKLEALIRVS
jgi:hypothetical protein